LSQWDKLIDEILELNKNLRFEDLAKATSMNKAYIEMVRDAVIEYESEVE